MKPVVAVVVAIVAVVALLFVATSPTAPPEMTDADREAVAREIIQRMHEGFADAAANNFEAMMTSLPSDPSAYFVGEPAMYLNRLVLLTDNEAIRTYWEPAGETRSGTNLIPSEEYVAVLSPDVALHVYEGDWSVLDLEGNVSSEGRIAATTLWVRENGVWKQLHYHQSWDTAAQEESTGG